MATNVENFSVIGVQVKEVEELANGMIQATMTPQQYGKLQPLLASRFVGVKTQYVVIELDPSDLAAAAEAGVKAPRAKREKTADDRITSKTVYAIESLPDDPNDVSYAEFDGEEGYVKINGARYEIQRGIAADFYEIGEKSDPERPVYYVNITAMNKEGTQAVNEDVTAYGVMNLLKSLLAVKTAIVE